MISIKALIFSAILITILAAPVKMHAKTKVSGPEFRWAMAHPFIALKAKKISERVILITDSIEKIGLLHDRSGGQLDAFKHALWMAMMAQQFKAKKAYKLGIAHEKFNYKSHKKAKGGGDKAASDMDLWNNKIGLDLGKTHPELSEDALIQLIVENVKEGAMKIIKKDAQGNALDAKGQLIDKSTLKTWVNQRCLVPSNYNFNS